MSNAIQFILNGSAVILHAHLVYSKWICGDLSIPSTQDILNGFAGFVNKNSKILQSRQNPSKDHNSFGSYPILILLLFSSNTYTLFTSSAHHQRKIQRGSGIFSHSFYHVLIFSLSFDFQNIPDPSSFFLFSSTLQHFYRQLFEELGGKPKLIKFSWILLISSSPPLLTHTLFTSLLHYQRRINIGLRTFLHLFFTFLSFVIHLIFKIFRTLFLFSSNSSQHTNFPFTFKRNWRKTRGTGGKQKSSENFIATQQVIKGDRCEKRVAPPR